MNSILDCLPQRPPFVMIDSMLESTPEYTISGFTILQDNIFVNDGCFTESGMIENMAQTAAAASGRQAAVSGCAAPVGYIVALKNVMVTSLPKVGDTISTKIIFGQSVLSFHLVNAAVSLNNEEIASCELKIYIKPEGK